MREVARWRPMAYGQLPPHKIVDPLCEPLWGGRRVFVEVSQGRVTIRDTDGADIEGYEALREAIAISAYADELLIDGSLLPAPLRDAEGARIRIGLDAVETPGSGQAHVRGPEPDDPEA